MKNAKLLIPILFICNIGFTQIEEVNLADLVSTKTNSRTHSIEWAFFKEGNRITRTGATEICSKLLSNRSEDSWQLIRSDQDQIGFSHDRYQQKYLNLEVEWSVYIFHFYDGELKSVNGDFVPNINISVNPGITVSQALNFAFDQLGNLAGPINLEESSSNLLITLIDGSPILAYKCQLRSTSDLGNKSIYIDAQTGKFLKEINQTCSVDVTGVAYTQFSGVQNITTNSVSQDNFELQQTTNGGGIVTLKPGLGLPHADSDNSWNNVNADEDEFATDVHFGAETSYDFYFNNFGRNSFDNLGTVVTSYACNNIASLAIWYGSTNTMLYGKGDENYYPSTSLEVVGHEFTHGVTQYSAGLIYADESGALSESFSDIFGSTIRKLYVPNVGSWYIGDQLLKPNGVGNFAFRNMANPNEFANPDTYGGLYFNTGDILHIDCGIQNFWYYLLVEGGTGTNDLGNSYSVTGIGLEDAMNIAYRNLTVYLTPSSTFEDARDGSEQAAIDLFGFCSEQHLNVMRAWYAVGLLDSNVPNTPTTNFTMSPSAPNMGQLVQFTDLSQSNPTSWLWNFGDGTTSTDQNPTHVFSQSGSYLVTLTCNFTNDFCGEVEDNFTFSIEIGNNLGIDDLTTSGNRFLIYPNPISTHVIISSGFDVEKLNYRVSDLCGRVMESGEFSHFGTAERTIELTTLSSGNYFLEIEYQADELIKSEKHRLTIFK